MWNNFLFTACAMVVDMVVGDPRLIPHPVRMIGVWIHFADLRWNKAQQDTPIRQRWRGVQLTASTVVGVYLCTFILIFALSYVSTTVAAILQIWLISTTFSKVQRLSPSSR